MRERALRFSVVLSAAAAHFLFLVTKRRLCFFLSEAPVYVDADLYGVCVGGEVAYYEIILYII